MASKADRSAIENAPWGGGRPGRRARARWRGEKISRDEVEEAREQRTQKEGEGAEVSQRRAAVCATLSLSVSIGTPFSVGGCGWDDSYQEEGREKRSEEEEESLEEQNRKTGEEEATEDGSEDERGEEEERQEGREEEGGEIVVVPLLGAPHNPLPPDRTPGLGQTHCIDSSLR